MNSNDIHFYMKIALPDGSYTNGKIDYNHHPQLLGLSEIDLSNLRVLDVAANDGFWSFWAEKSGSQDILAIDIDSFELYDWGYDGCPPDILPKQSLKTHPSQWTDAGAGFWYLHKVFNSQVQRQCLSTYDLSTQKHGFFDLIFHYGLLYHLRHPLLALDKLRKVCSGILILETHMINFLGNLPASLFYWDDVHKTHTNWTGPSEGSIVAWLKSAGFPHIFSKVMNRTSPYTRGVFIACVNDRWYSHFKKNENLFYYDESYMSSLHNITKNSLEGKDFGLFKSTEVAEIYFQHGKELLELGEGDKAITKFSKALELDCSRAVYFSICQARAYRACKKYSKALEILEEAYNLNLATISELHMMANTFVSLNSVERAIEIYEKAVKLAPNDEKLQANYLFAKSKR